LSLYGRLVTLAAAVLLAATLAGCGAGGEEKPEGGTISDEDLTAMVLTKADLGPEFADVQESAAPDTNEERIQKADDPEDERKDQQTFGRISGYDRELVASPATIQAEAPLLIHMGVTLFGNGAGAAGEIDDAVGDIRARIGRTDLGMLLETVDEFPVPPLGDQALGLRTRASAPPEQGGQGTVYVTYVWFRRDRIIGDVAIARSDDVDVSQQAQTIASLLDERIQQVLSGQATPPPTSTP
jgi:hypothetical protein